MKYEINGNPQRRLETLPSVTLELSAEELTLLSALAYRGMTGTHPARNEVETTLFEAFEAVTGIAPGKVFYTGRVGEYLIADSINIVNLELLARDK